MTKTAAAKTTVAAAARRLVVVAALGGAGAGGGGAGAGGGIPTPSSTDLRAALAALLGLFGGGAPGIGGGGNDGDLALRLLEFAFSPWRDASSPCLTCARPCSGPGGRVDPAAAGAATAALVRAIDAALRRHKRTTLARELRGRLASLLRSKSSRATAGTVLALAAPVARTSRRARVAVLRYVMVTYAEWYVPGLRYDVDGINALAFRGPFRAAALAFLAGRDADLAPLAGVLARHLVDSNVRPVSALVGPACALCRRLPQACAARGQTSSRGGRPSGPSAVRRRR